MLHSLGLLSASLVLANKSPGKCVKLVIQHVQMLHSLMSEFSRACYFSLNDQKGTVHDILSYYSYMQTKYLLHWF